MSSAVHSLRIPLLKPDQQLGLGHGKTWTFLPAEEKGDFFFLFLFFNWTNSRKMCKKKADWVSGPGDGALSLFFHAGGADC